MVVKNSCNTNRTKLQSSQYSYSPFIRHSVQRKLPSNGIFFRIAIYSSHWTKLVVFDVHVTVRRDKFIIIKPTRCTNFSNLFWNEITCFGQFLCPTSGVFHCTHSNGMCHTGLQTACEQDQDGTLILLSSCLQTCMTYTVAVCTAKNSWWWTEELSETCRVSIPK
jgi:hypothetical protein